MNMKLKLKQICLTGLVVFWAAAACAERVAVDVELANVRSGPGTQYKLLWKLEKHHPVDVLQKSGGWFYVQDFEGDKGWIYGKLVNGDKAVIVDKVKCNVRSGPGTEHDIIFTVERGVPFKVLERKGEWLHIRHADGDVGWIHRTLVW